MKKSVASLTLILCISLFSFISRTTKLSKIEDYPDQNMKYSGIPPAGKTGAPNEGICFNCHSLGSLNGPAGNISIDFNNGTNTYQLDSTYIVKVKVKEIGSTAFGFESTILDNNMSREGSYTIIDSLKTAFQPLLGREYISHNTVWNSLATDSLEWQFKWTAPSTNMGPLTIYSAGVATFTLISIAAGNVYNDSLKIYPDSLTSINETSNISDRINIYPNPAKNYFFINGDIPLNSRVFVYNLNGQRVKSFWTKGLETNKYDIHELPSGVYIVSYIIKNQSFTNKIILYK